MDHFNRALPRSATGRYHNRVCHVPVEFRPASVQLSGPREKNRPLSRPGPATATLAAGFSSAILVADTINQPMQTSIARLRRQFMIQPPAAVWRAACSVFTWSMMRSVLGKPKKRDHSPVRPSPTSTMEGWFSKFGV